jgi:hypothetical protein
LTSIKIGFAPAMLIASAVAMKVFTAVMTSSPEPTPSPVNASHNAEVPLDEPTEYFVWQ